MFGVRGGLRIGRNTNKSETFGRYEGSCKQEAGLGNCSEEWLNSMSHLNAYPSPWRHQEPRSGELRPKGVHACPLSDARERTFPQHSIASQLTSHSKKHLSMKRTHGSLETNHPAQPACNLPAPFTG